VLLKVNSQKSIVGYRVFRNVHLSTSELQLWRGLQVVVESSNKLLREENENYSQMGRTKIHVGTGMISGEITKVGPLFQ